MDSNRYVEKKKASSIAEGFVPKTGFELVLAINIL